MTLHRRSPIRGEPRRRPLGGAKSASFGASESSSAVGTGATMNPVRSLPDAQWNTTGPVSPTMERCEKVADFLRK